MKKLFILFYLIVGALASSVVNAASYSSCDQFVGAWLKNYQYASKYYSYTCEKTKENEAKFVIFGKPGTLTFDQWFYQPQKNRVMRLSSNTSYGMKPTEYYNPNSFVKTGESDTVGNFIKPSNASAQEAVKGTYCAAQQGMPPVGCELTLETCRKVIEGLPGMSCFNTR